MFNNIKKMFKKDETTKVEEEKKENKDTAKERLHLVLLQDRANVSADFLDMMRQEIIDVIRKYVDVDEGDIDVKLTNKQNGDGTVGAPALYANIPIKSIKLDDKLSEFAKPAPGSEEKESKEVDSESSSEEVVKEETIEDKVEEKIEEKAEAPKEEKKETKKTSKKKSKENTQSKSKKSKTKKDKK